MRGSKAGGYNLNLNEHTHLSKRLHRGEIKGMQGGMIHKLLDRLIIYRSLSLIYCLCLFDTMLSKELVFYGNPLHKKLVDEGGEMGYVRFVHEKLPNLRKLDGISMVEVPV